MGVPSRSFHFQPFPGLTVFTLIALAILITLGTWQYKRLVWKTALLSEVEEAAVAPPFSSFTDVQAALERGEPIDFRRIGVEAEIVNTQPFYVFTPQNRDVSWRVFLPARQNGQQVFTALNVISDAEREQGNKPAPAALKIYGYVRLARAATRGAARSTPEKNRWFSFNPMPETHSWGEMISGETDMRFYIDRVQDAENAATLPERRPNIRNNHFDYMLTWYGLALCLLIIYCVLHYQNGRLGFRTHNGK